MIASSSPPHAQNVASNAGDPLVIPAGDQLSAVSSVETASRRRADAQKLIYIPETSAPLAHETIAAQGLRFSLASEDNDDVEDLHARVDWLEELLATPAA